MGNTEGIARPRKRSRMSDDADDATAASGGKKVRGRPRVDTQDATAADVSTYSLSCSQIAVLYITSPR